MTPLEYLERVREEKHCYVCMKKTKIEPHHIDQIGMGRNRKKELQEHYSAIPVCRPCHQEYHKVGKETFEFKYGVSAYELVYDAISKILYENYKQNQETI